MSNNVQAMTIAMFGAAAGAYTAELEASVEANGVAAVANSIMNLQQPLLGLDLSDDADWTDFVLANLGINDTNAAYGTAAAYFADRLADGATRGDVIAEAVAYLLGGNESAEFADIAAAFVAQVEAAEAWSLDAGATVLDIGTLRAGADGDSTTPAADPAVFNLTAALATLEGANTDLEEFLTGLDLDDDGEADTDDAAVADANLDTALADAWTDADALIDGSYVSGNTDAVNAALLSNQEAQNAADLTIAQNNLTAANAAVNAVTGLQAAITAYEAAVETAADTQDARTKAGIAYAAAMNTYNVDAAAADDITDTTVTLGDKSDAGGVIIDVTQTAGVYSVKLATGVTETTNPGITAVLTAAQAFVAAVNADNTADAAVATKAAAVLALDPTWNDDAITAAAVADAEEALDAALVAQDDAITTSNASQVALAAAQTADTNAQNALDAAILADDAADLAVSDFAALVTDYEAAAAAYAADDANATLQADLIAAYSALLAGGAMPTSAATPDVDDAVYAANILADAFDTQSAITAEESALAATAAGTQSDLDAAQTAADDAAAALVAAQATADADDAAVTAAIGDVADATTALAAAEADEAIAAGTTSLYEAQEAAADAVETAQTAIDDLAEAIAALNALKGLDDQRDDLETAVSDAEQAIEDAGYDLEDAMVGDDLEVYTAEAQDGNDITLGADDVLVVSGYTYNDGDIDTDGSNTALEFFLTEVGGDVVVSFETEVFGSNSTDAELEVTLTGVTIDELMIGSNYIQLA